MRPRSLRALTWLLVLLVLVPAGVLGWLGFQAADAYDAAVAGQIRRELDQAEEEVRRLSARVLDETAAALHLALADLADEVRRRLPFQTPGEVIHGLGGRHLWLSGDHAEGESPVMATILNAELLDADGRVLYPLVYEPLDGTPAADTPAELLDHLRREADGLLFAGEGADAAAAVWRDARDRMSSDVLRATCDVEVALIGARAAGGPGAKVLAEEVDRAWNLDLLWRVGRPAVRLWIAAASDGYPPSYRGRLHDALLEGRLVEIPLTDVERDWIRTTARRYHETLSRRDSTVAPETRHLHDPRGWRPPNRRVEVDVANGSRLALWIGGASLWAHMRDRVRDLGTWGPVQLGFQEAGPGVPMRAASQGGVEIARPIVIQGPDAMVAAVHLSHLEARDRLRTRDIRRVVTTVGVVSLLLVMLIGIVLVRRAVVREQAARRLRDDFIANVSHELRTPLTSVCMHAEMLADDDPPAERRRDLAHVVRAEGARLASLVDDLLDFAALERGVREIEKEPVDLARAVREAAAPYDTLARQEGVTLDVEVPEGELVALADPGALSRILANLLSNAWRHGRPSRDGHAGRIRVRAYDGAGASGPSVEVRDDGAGIPDEERQLIFERFRRGRSASRVEGTGLGLALGRELARSMNGELEIVDVPEETVFRLTLEAFTPETP